MISTLQRYSRVWEQGRKLSASVLENFPGELQVVPFLYPFLAARLVDVLSVEKFVKLARFNRIN